MVNAAPIPQNSALTAAGAEPFITTSHLTLIAKFDGKFAPGSQTYAGSGSGCAIRGEKRRVRCQRYGLLA